MQDSKYDGQWPYCSVLTAQVEEQNLKGLLEGPFPQTIDAIDGLIQDSRMVLPERRKLPFRFLAVHGPRRGVLAHLPDIGSSAWP